MKIMKIAGRKIQGYVMGVVLPDGTVAKKFMPLPNQGLGTGCHKLTEAILPTGVTTNSWNDRPKDEVTHQEEIAYEQPEALGQ